MTFGMPFPDSVPLLTDGVVRLRPHAERDVDRIVEQCTDPASLRWTQVPRGYTAEMGREWIGEIAAGLGREGGDQLWAIEEVTGAEGHGLPRARSTCGPAPAGRAEIGYGLHPDGRGRGLMARALRLVDQYWFDAGGRRVDWYAERGQLRLLGGRPGPPGSSSSRPCPSTSPTVTAASSTRGSPRLGRDDPMEPRTAWISAAGPRGRRHPAARVARRRRRERRGARPPRALHSRPAAIPTAETWDDWLIRRRLFMARGSSVNWCIADAESDVALGEVLVFVHVGALADGDTAELGYFLYPRARGPGRGPHGGSPRGRPRLRPSGRRRAGPAPARRRDRRRQRGEQRDPRVGRLQPLGPRGRRPTAPDGSVGPADHWELLRPSPGSG